MGGGGTAAHASTDPVFLDGSNMSRSIIVIVKNGPKNSIEIPSDAAL